MDLFDVSASDIFVTSAQLQTQFEALSNQALQRGIDHYTKKNYTGAVSEFQRSINMNPNGQYMATATKYLAQTYLKLDQTDKAVEAYRNALKRDPNNDELYSALGQVLFVNNRFDEALKAYQGAVKANPVSSENQYSLGQAYLKLGQLGPAKEAFDRVIRIEPNSPYGYFGMGQAYENDGDSERAIEQFEKAIAKKSDYYDAYAEMGYVYADSGEGKKADKILDFLENKDSDLYSLLKAYINKVEKPKIAFAWGSSTFRYSMTTKTPVSVMDSYLQNAGASVNMNIKIQFTKEMDRSSVENVLNWSISRAAGSGPAQTYNFGEAVPSTEISLPSIPSYVLYDKDNMTATIGFAVTQNSTADGTIDPGHIVFKFKGKDIDGNQIDPKADEYSGFSKVA